MTAVAEQTVITEPGVYDIPEADYHADPVPGGSLSSTGIRKLLDCPARFDWDRRNPPQPTAAMELGTAAHRLVLGTGAELAVIDAPDWRTKAAKESADEARAAGKLPLLTHEHAQVLDMAAALRGHPHAGPLLTGDGGQSEQSLFWVGTDGPWSR